MTAPMRAADFTGSIGVAAQLVALNGTAKSAATVQAVSFLGISNLRTTMTAALLQPGSVADKLAAAGVHFDVLLGGLRPLADSLRNAEAFAAAHPGAITAIEGPNEINLWPIPFAGQTGVAAAVSFVDAAAAKMRTGALAGVALYDFTGASRTAATMADASTAVSIHPYPQNGDQPYNWLKAEVMSHAVPGKDMVITEAGYTTTTGASAFEGVDPLTQAKLTLNLLADAAVLGAEKTFLYQLFDTGPAGGAEAGFGLFDANGKPKLAATAIHNLTAILADPGAGTFSPHDLSYTVSGLPQGAHTLLIEKSNGTYELMIWAEPDIWDQAGNRALTAPGQDVTITLGGGSASLKVFDPLLSANPLASAQGNSITARLTDHVLVVEIAGLPAGSAVAPTKFDAPIKFSGTAGAEVLTGANGDDVLMGQGGADTIHGGGGADRIIGGMGADVLWGGEGADTFAFLTVGESKPQAGERDIIRDFSAAAGDRIDLTLLDANVRLAGNQEFTLGGDHFTGRAGELIQSYADHGVLVQADLNGDRRADFSFLLGGAEQPLPVGAFVL